MAITTLSPRHFPHLDLYRNCLLCATVFLLCQITGCKKESSPVSPSTGGGGKIVVGTSVDLGPMVVPSSGGTLTVTRSGSPVDGMQIKVPRNSYTDSRTFQVSYAPVVSHQLPTNVTLISPLITISNGGGYADSVMTVKIPVKVPSGYFAMGFFYNDATGELEGLPSVRKDSSWVIVGTRHFASSSLGPTSGFPKGFFRGDADPAVRSNVVIATIKELELNANYDTGFRPGVDDWGFPNCGSYIAPKGHCSGQSTGALWYYVEKKSKGSPSLWKRFDNDGNAPKTPDIWEDDVLAYRFCSAIQSDNNLSFADEMVVALQADPIFGDLETYYLFSFSIYMTKRPQYVAVNNFVPREGHALIVYGVAGRQLFVCDPNYPGDLNRRIIMNSMYFDPYYSGPNAKKLGTAYNHIWYLGFTPVIDLHPVDTRWQELSNKTVGNNLFPSFTILTENDTLKFQELKDGFTKKNGTFALQVQADKFDPIFWVREPSGSVLSIGKPFHLSKGTYRIGVTVLDRDTNWVGFRWFTVNADSDTTKIFPLKLLNSWEYIYSSFQENGALVSTDIRTYSVVGDMVVSGEHWYQLQMTQGTSTPTIGFFTNRSDGAWLSIQPGATTPHLLYKFPGVVGDTYSSGADGATTVTIQQKEVTASVPGHGTFKHCYVYRQTRQFSKSYTEVTVAPGLGVVKTSEFEEMSTGGGMFYVVRDELLANFTLK